MDIMKNEIKIDNVQTLPQVLLYNKYLKNDPSPMSGRDDFDGLMRFLENNAILNYSGDLWLFVRSFILFWIVFDGKKI